MVDSPVVPGYPSQATCTGAGLRAKTSSRLLASMQFQVDQDVDLIAAHQVGELLVGEPHAAAPDVGLATQPLGQGIRPCHVGVAEDLELPVIMVRQKRNRKEAIDVALAKIG